MRKPDKKCPEFGDSLRYMRSELAGWEASARRADIPCGAASGVRDRSRILIERDESSKVIDVRNLEPNRVAIPFSGICGLS